MPPVTDPCCPLCAATAHFAFQAGDSFYRVTDYRASLFRCSACAALFQHPIPNRDNIADFYPSGYWQEHTPDTTIQKLQQTYINFMLKADLMHWVKRLRLPPNARYLDVGCSRGDWLAQIRSAGYQVSGIEADPRAAHYARTVHGISVETVDDASWQPAAADYDAISFFHLLEHLSDPEAFLDKVYKALPPGGKILLRVPYINSFQARLLGKRWKGLEMPRHIVMFSKKGLLGLLARKGFRLEQVSSWALRDGPPCLTSSLLPSGEPTWQQIHRKPSAFLTLLYLTLTWLLTPLELCAALFGRGAMLTLIARRD